MTFDEVNIRIDQPMEHDIHQFELTPNSTDCSPDILICPTSAIINLIVYRK
jgi:hypothetical protein